MRNWLLEVKLKYGYYTEYINNPVWYYGYSMVSITYYFHVAYVVSFFYLCLLLILLIYDWEKFSVSTIEVILVASVIFSSKFLGRMPLVNISYVLTELRKSSWVLFSLLSLSTGNWWHAIVIALLLYSLTIWFVNNSSRSRYVVFPPIVLLQLVYGRGIQESRNAAYQVLFNPKLSSFLLTLYLCSR